MMLKKYLLLKPFLYLFILILLLGICIILVSSDILEVFYILSSYIISYFYLPLFLCLKIHY